MAETLVFWFRQHYRLPPNHPSLDELTLEDIEAEFWAHRYYENPTADEVVDEDFDLEAVMREAEAGGGTEAGGGGDDWQELVSIDGRQ